MKSKIIKQITILIMLVFVLISFKEVCLAADTEDILKTEDYNTTLQYDEASYIFEKGGAIIQILRNLAAIISVVTLSIIGLRYMVGSIDQKAEYKQTMMPVVIGCILIAGLSGILTLIQGIF